MNAQRLVTIMLAVLMALGVIAGSSQAQAPDPQSPDPLSDLTGQLAAPDATLVSTAFTYQGQLKNNGAPVNGSCDFEFTLWDAVSGGSQVAGPLAKPNIVVSNGLFTVASMTFSEMELRGDARWMRVGVKCPAGSGGAYTYLEPRQALTATPYALSLRPGAMVRGAVYGAYPGSVIWAENTATTPTDPVSAVRGVTSAPRTSGVSGQSTNGYGGAFSSLGSHALVTSGPSLIAGRNPAQIGMLRWYDANETRHGLPSASQPRLMAFDGAHVWVANNFVNNVVKFRAADGEFMGSYPTPPNPYALAFDGFYMWVASTATPGTVTKMTASRGEIAKTLTTADGLPASAHYGIAFDGKYIWVTNAATNSITKIAAKEATVVGTYAAGPYPYSVLYDGTAIWVSNNTVGAGSVTKLNRDTGAIAGTYAVGATPGGMAFDGANIWVANLNSASVSQVRAADGAVLGTYPVNASPHFMVFDGYYVWITHNGEGGGLTRLVASNPSLPAKSYATGRWPQGLVFDGANVWVANGDEASLTKY